MRINDYDLHAICETRHAERARRKLRIDNKFHRVNSSPFWRVVSHNYSQHLLTDKANAPAVVISQLLIPDSTCSITHHFFHGHRYHQCSIYRHWQIGFGGLFGDGHGYSTDRLHYRLNNVLRVVQLS